MDRKIPDDVREIVAEAKSLPPNERDAYVRRICGDDENLAGACLSQMMIGTRVSAYRIERELGRGGMGSVYLAHRDDGVLDMTVCIKLIRPDALHPHFQKRFRRERQILADLKHPHIATLLDAGNTDTGQPYFLMEYIDGQTIDHWCTNSHPALYDLLQVIRKVAVALGFAHGAGVVHRDIKPNNLMMDRTGEPKLLDFGIAHRENPNEASLTAVGDSPMTPAYASPEQFMGELPTAASDLYSLGIVLLEMLTGEHPRWMEISPLEAVSQLMSKGRGFAYSFRYQQTLRDLPLQFERNPPPAFDSDDEAPTLDTPIMAHDRETSDSDPGPGPDPERAEDSESPPSMSESHGEASHAPLDPLPEGLGYVLRRMLDPDLDKRYRSAKELIDGLDQVMAGLNHTEKATVEKTFDALFWHHPRDTETVAILADYLEGPANLKVWQASERSRTHISSEWERALPRTRTCIVCQGPASTKRGLTPWDEEPAMRDLLGYHKASLDFIPLLLPGARLPDKQSELPVFLRGLAWVGLDDVDETNMKRLASRIEGNLVHRLDRPEPTGLCPFRGLEVFREEDRHLFFGRESLIQRITSYMTDHAFGAVLGPSGSGKSSIVQAGVIPWLRERNQEVLLFKPDRRPIEELVFALRGLFGGANLNLPTEQWYNRLSGSAEALHFIAREILEITKKKKLCLVIDQFEEVFTLAENDAERAAFVAGLCYAVDRPKPYLSVLLTMRSDFLGKCAAYPDLNNYVIDHLMQVPPMNREELARSIECPAALAGLTLEPGLLNRILDDVAGSPGELPLLEHALLELYERHQEGLLTQAAYDEIGGIEGALAKRAENEYGAVDAAGRHVLRRMFALCLVQPGEGVEDSRRRATKEELIAVGGERVEPLLQRWTASRLLTGTRDEGRDLDIVDVAHEALIRRWHRIGEWMAEDRETARLIHRLRRAAATWEAANRDEDHLLRGGPLYQMKDLVTREADHLTDLERAFVAAGVALAEKEVHAREATIARLRRRRNQAVVASAFALLLAAFAFFQRALILRERDAVDRERQTAERVTDFMLSMFDHVDPDLARGGEVTAFEVMENGRHQIDRSLADQPEIQARLMTTMGRVYRKLGHHAISRELLEGAVAHADAPMTDENQAPWELIRTLETEGDYEGMQARLDHLAERLEAKASPLQIARLEHARGRLWFQLGHYLNADKAYERATTHLPNTEEAIGERLALLRDRAALQSALGFYDKSIGELRELLTLQRNHYGEEHSEVAATYAMLGIQHQKKGDYPQAARRFDQAENIYRNRFGPRHPHLIGCLTRSGELLQARGDYGAAEPLLHRALTLTRDLLGERHPQVALALNNLAMLQEAKGDYAAAEPLYRQALTLQTERLGDNHPEVAGSLNHLAILFRKKGDYTNAEPLYRRALDMRIALLGETHPSVASSLNNLAILHWSKGNYAAAEPLLRQALEIQTAMLGKNHPRVSDSLHNLALLLRKRGDHAAAEPLSRQSLAMRIERLGEDHPKVGASLNNLANILWDMGDYAAAEPLLRKALAIYRSQLGDAHPYLATSLHNLACMLVEKGDYAAAEPIFQRALAMRTDLLGKTHPRSIGTLENLADLLAKKAEYAAAEPLIRQVLAGYTELHGDGHPTVAMNLSRLADVLMRTGDYPSAETHYHKSLELFRNKLGEDHRQFIASLWQTGEFYLVSGDLRQAESYYRKALATSEAQPSIEKEDLIPIHKGLAAVLLRGDQRDADIGQIETLLSEAHEAARDLQNPLLGASVGLERALLKMRRQDVNGAKTELENVLDLRRRSLGDAHPEVAAALLPLAIANADLERPDRALSLVEEATAIYTAALPDTHESHQVAASIKGRILVDLGRKRDGLSLLGRAHRTLVDRLGEDHYLVRDAQKRLAAATEN
ncbi:Non-specific serine/threonine protein kinase [Sulfidibacter corallicola]|uniref:Tetratricopeptide repeat protein n=1 Tax=Sulfidibacter corallicola TaxID=2818388 RepID=A0A8A4TXQ4_SULCO|nr:serine/threonine-protein kinase [Sulfidibacter corallicola]QTD54263.1 tetratricopeptide repeat protein [Sulfidibacter corallicola]